MRWAHMVRTLGDALSHMLSALNGTKTATLRASIQLVSIFSELFIIFE